MRAVVTFNFVFLVVALVSTGLFGQAVSQLPRAEYYLAKELLGAGRTAEASDGFRAAFQRARQVGDLRWVDSIPPLIMLGECYYQQGSLALALEQYDAALMLALANPAWIDQIEVGIEQLPEFEGAAKGIDWFQKSRRSRSVAVPEAVQISIDPTKAQVDPNGVVVAPISLVTQLDATEVMRTLGLAMLRRWQVLGPLSKHSPLAEPLAKLFVRNPVQQAVWVNASWRILRGISRLSTNASADSPALIRSGLLLGNRFDYYMTPLGLLALAELDARNGNYQAAIVSLQDATLLAAQYEQHSELAESLTLLSSCAAASFRIELGAPLQRVAAWSSKRSGMSQAAATIGAAELAIYARNYSLADKLHKQGAVALRLREIGLPRYRAQLSFNNARLAFSQNRSSLGISHLNTALEIMHGTAQTGAVVESVFQAQMTLDLLASGAITAAAAEQILEQVLAEPSAVAWQVTPMKTLAAITTSSVPAYERLLELASIRGDQEQVLARLDRLQRQRFYEALPLGGRLLSWRHAVSTDPAILPPNVRQVVGNTLQRFPEIPNTTGRLQAIIDQLRRAPIPLDERQIPAGDKRLFAELSELSDRHENQIALQTLLRKPLDRFLPIHASLSSTQQELNDNDVLVALAMTSQRIFGFAITKNKIEHWLIDDPQAVDAKLRLLLIEIGLVRQQAGQLPSTLVAHDAAWRSSTGELLDLLFPAAIQQMLRRSKRIIIAPNDRLWYIPFELLPETSKPGAEHLQEHHAITYIPTAGSIGKAFQTIPTVNGTIGLTGSFFSVDAETNQEQADRLIAGIPNSNGISLTKKLTVPSSVWLRLRMDQLWVATRIKNPGIPWDRIIMPFGKAKQATLGSMLATPRGAPASIILPGIETSLLGGQLGDGNDIFLPACGLLFSGTRSALLSRWPVGGKSSASLLLRYLEETRGESSSAALRRAVLAQWTESFLVADEPVLLPAGKEAAALTSGRHPLLWGGYMAIGDTMSK